MNLFIDTTNSCLILILENQNKVIDSSFVAGLPRISDVTVDFVGEFLSKNSITIKDIKNFYVTLGPGTYTGVRVGVSVVKTLKALNNDFGVYTISSLHFQAGTNKVISLLDARGGKRYLGIYSDGKNIIVDQVIDAEYVIDFAEQFSDFQICEDYQAIDPIKNYLALKPFFNKVTNVKDFNPVYIKSFT